MLAQVQPGEAERVIELPLLDVLGMRGRASTPDFAPARGTAAALVDGLAVSQIGTEFTFETFTGLRQKPEPDNPRG